MQNVGEIELKKMETSDIHVMLQIKNVLIVEITYTNYITGSVKNALIELSIIVLDVSLSTWIVLDRFVKYVSHIR